MRQMCINVSKITRWGRTAAGIILPVNFINNNSLSDLDMLFATLFWLLLTINASGDEHFPLFQLLGVIHL